MSTHVDRLVSDVVPESEAPPQQIPPSGGGDSLPQDVLQRRLRRLERLEARTRARDFED